MGSGEESGISVVPLAPASILAIPLTYSDFTSRQCKSGAAPLKAVELLWAPVSPLRLVSGSLGRQAAAATCPAQLFALQNPPSSVLQPPLYV